MSFEASVPSYPSSRRARYSQAILVAIAFFTAMDIYVISLLVEPIKHDLGLTDVEVGIANTSALYGAYALFCIPMGLLVDRSNRVRMLAVAMAMWCLGLLLAAFSQGLWLLVGSKAVLGIANAMTLPAAMSLLADYFAPERRAMATMSYGLGQGFGQAGAVFIGGIGLGALTRAAMGDPGFLFGLAPWRLVSLSFAAAGALLIPVILTLREPQRMEGRQAGGGTLRELWAYRDFLVPLLAGTTFLSGMSTGVLNWIPPALTRLYGQEPSQFAGWFGTVSLVSVLAGMLAGGKLGERFHRHAGRDGVLRPAAVAAAVCAPASFMAMMPDLAWFAASTVCFTIAYAIAISIPMIAIALRIPNQLRGAAMGFYIVTVSLAGVVAAPLVAWVGAALGGEDMLGRGMAAVGAPSACLAALSFWWASRPAVHDELSHEDLVVARRRPV
ncbi:MFS transporter [Novosphingobium sp. PS1R-30]|uniref:MFS transporter n=1 Tax=Novosphingobium anseongense TaxID=3133436 RepID=A0ABU8S331_9SPHN